MEKKLILVLVFTFILILTGCEKKVTNDTPENAAKYFVNALIKADEKLINNINKSGMFSFPTAYIISDIADQYAGMDVDDFKFLEEIGQYTISVFFYNEKEDFIKKIIVKEIEGAYYFDDFGNSFKEDKERFISK